MNANTDWYEALEEMLPYLGHRNWIVITDMAYPLQSGKGITTLYAHEAYIDVLRKVKTLLDGAPHVFPHVYHDRELDFINEDILPGITALQYGISEVCGPEVKSIPHEELLHRMDEAGKLYNIVIIKTPLTTAYTSTFFELDCAYWTAEQQKALDEAMKQG